MTYQYLTVDMVNAAKANGGFIDQKIFKTAGKYSFDSLILTDASMQVLDNYISFVRPLLNPPYAYVLITRNGDQHSKLGDVLSKLVFDAISKYIYPTRYRQIVETQSLNQLTSSEQKILSEDQKQFCHGKNSLSNAATVQSCCQGPRMSTKTAGKREFRGRRRCAREICSLT